MSEDSSGGYGQPRQDGQYQQDQYGYQAGRQPAPQPQYGQQPAYGQQPQYGQPYGQQPPMGQPPMGMPPQPRKGLGGLAVAGIAAAALVAGLGIGFLVFHDPDGGAPDDEPPAQVVTQGDDEEGDATGTAAGDDKKGDATGTGNGDDAAGTGDGTQATPAQAPAQAAPGDLSGSWQDGVISVNGVTYVLGQTPYSDLEAAGWRPDEMTQRTIDETYGGQYILNPSTKTIGFSFENDGLNGFDGLTVDLANVGGAAADFRECVVAGIDVDVAYMSTGEVAPDAVVAGGARLGMRLDDIIALYGEPTDTYRSDDTDYASIEYQKDDYSMSVSFRSTSGGICDEIHYRLV